MAVEQTVRIIWVCAALVIALGVMLGLVLHHHIGGFLSTIEREEEEEARRRDETSNPSNNVNGDGSIK